MNTIVTGKAEVHDSVDTRPPLAKAGVSSIALAGAVMLFVSIGRYGFFGDELYFLSAGRRLDFSYADQGPLLPLLAHLMDLIAPGSLFWLRVPAVLVTFGAVVVAALIAREFGGGRSAQLLTATAYVTSPFLLIQGDTLATNTVDTALWAVITLLVVRWVRTRADGLLLLAGLLTAVDMQCKWLIPFFWVATGVSALIFGPRDLFRRPMLWLGGVITVLATLPSLIWQANHGWPQLKMGPIVAAESGGNLGRAIFLPSAVMLLGLLGAILLGYGLWRLFRAQSLRPYRFFGLATILLAVAFIIEGGRPYYLAGMYALLIAAGAVELTRRDLRRWARRLVVPVVAVSLVLTVLGLPWKPAAWIQPATSVTQAATELSTYGKFGWPELAAATAKAYHSLPAWQQKHTVVLASTYWQAGALDQFGGRYGLPEVYSPNRGFYYFGAPPDSATTVLYLGPDVTALRPMFGTVRALAKSQARLGIPGTVAGATVWECSNPTEPWSVRWPQLFRLTA